MPVSRTCLSLLFSAVLSSTSLPAAGPVVPIDFSSAGYGGGGVALPAVPARLRVAPRGDGQDDTASIQAALDAVGRLEPDANGFRGAVVFEPAATYIIAGRLRIRASGVVLRGNGTTLLATGQSRRTLIEVRGAADRTLGPARAVTDPHVPAGAVTLTVADTAGLAPGMRVVVRRPSTTEWISALGMDSFRTAFAPTRVNWPAGTRDLEWERTLTAVDAATRTLTLDAPITTALEERYGGGTVHTLAWPGRLRQVGVENLECASTFDPANLLDEDHAWIAIRLDDVEDAWVRRVTVRHFAGSAVYVGPQARAITVEDCAYVTPIAENGGWRRLGFYAGGQQILMRGCTATGGRRDFVAGFCSAGPNVFLDCAATGALADSGPFESWASGALYDNVHIEGAGLALRNVGLSAQGAGWTAANCVLWNCTAVALRVDPAPGAPNLAVTDPATPSLYRAQLAARRGADAGRSVDFTALIAADRQADAFTAPPESTEPEPATPARPLAIVNGRFTAGGHLLLGDARSNGWWRGQIIPSWSEKVAAPPRIPGMRHQNIPVWAPLLDPNPVRWAPGHDGPGMTEDLGELIGRMRAHGTAFFRIWPALWQDRRRDDHSRFWREDGDTWAPFFELPWARSGVGRAADGLSKFDLTRFNPWYWSRLRETARQSAVTGLVLLNYFYNNHNLQEAGSHWVDFPWRPANCLQATGFPEPPPFDGAQNNTIHVADRFYDVSHPVRRDLHTRYIRHGLEVFAGEPNVIHSLGFEFAGPEEFQKFFLGVVADWNRTATQPARIALHTSKAVTDAVLADPALEPHVAVIDLCYWTYLPDGTLYAPDGKGRRAFRELRYRTFNADTIPAGTPELAYRQVREYRDRFPGKALLASHGGVGLIPAMMAGAAAVVSGDAHVAEDNMSRAAGAAFLRFLREQVGDALIAMNPRNPVEAATWCLADEGRHALLYSLRGGTLDVPADFRGAGFNATWFDPRTGSTQAAPPPAATIVKPTAEPWLLWLKRGERSTPEPQPTQTTGIIRPQ